MLAIYPSLDEDFNIRIELTFLSSHYFLIFLNLKINLSHVKLCFNQTVDNQFG